ncbi:MAG: transcriptional repressor LexA [Armatimonadetes bacterium]|nr:transcriptional repressor LexA [Armatimonadota bacterium]
MVYLVKGRLTQRQQSVFDFVIGYIDRHGYPPSIREIGAAFGIKSLRGVTVHLDALEKKGFIRRESTSRSIQILRQHASPDGSAFLRVPILGTIAAGTPLLAVENIEGEMSVPRAMLGGTEGGFLLRVRGDSMTGAHIMDGDLVVIRPQQTAENGDLVAALLGEEATVKRFRSEGGRASLVPANPAYQPIPLKGRDARLIGKVVGLMRVY